MPTAYGAEFRQDGIDVARKGDAPLAQIAKDFGLSVTTLKRWIAFAERKDSGSGPGAAESAQMRELKRRNRLLEHENEILRRAAASIWRGTTQNDLPAGHGSCAKRRPRGGDLSVLKFSKQGYYRWRASRGTEREWADAHLVNAARNSHADDPAFSYRFIADELPEKGLASGDNRVQRLCRDHGIWSVCSKKQGVNRKPGPPVHDDLAERDFRRIEGIDDERYQGSAGFRALRVPSLWLAGATAASCLAPEMGHIHIADRKSQFPAASTKWSSSAASRHGRNGTHRYGDRSLNTSAIEMCGPDVLPRNRRPESVRAISNLFRQTLSR